MLGFEDIVPLPPPKTFDEEAIVAEMLRLCRPASRSVSASCVLVGR